jgi:hypothetical protein
MRGQVTCGSRSYVRLTPTASDTSPKHKAPTRGMQPRSALMPSSPPMMPALMRANVIAPASSAVHAARPRLGWTLSRSCTPWRSRTGKYKPPSATTSQCCLSTPPLSRAAAGLTLSLGRRPRHAMPRPGGTAYAVPRHPQRDIVPCCAPGWYCLCPRAATSPSPWPCSRFLHRDRWLCYQHRGSRVHLHGPPEGHRHRRCLCGAPSLYSSPPPSGHDSGSSNLCTPRPAEADHRWHSWSRMATRSSPSLGSRTGT